jgi:hypothetical protein
MRGGNVFLFNGNPYDSCGTYKEGGPRVVNEGEKRYNRIWNELYYNLNLPPEDLTASLVGNLAKYIKEAEKYAKEEYELYHQQIYFTAENMNGLRDMYRSIVEKSHGGKQSKNRSWLCLSLPIILSTTLLYGSPQTKPRDMDAALIPNKLSELRVNTPNFKDMLKAKKVYIAPTFSKQKSPSLIGGR